MIIPLGYLHLKRKCLPTGTFNSGVLNLGSITPEGPLLDFRGSMKALALSEFSICVLTRVFQKPTAFIKFSQIDHNPSKHLLSPPCGPRTTRPSWCYFITTSQQLGKGGIFSYSSFYRRGHRRSLKQQSWNPNPGLSNAKLWLFPVIRPPHHSITPTRGLMEPNIRTGPALDRSCRGFNFCFPDD